jgi:hypothetical protein
MHRGNAFVFEAPEPFVYPTDKPQGPNSVGDCCLQPSAVLIWTVPGETESGSAGEQPDKGYPGRGCASGVTSPWQAILSGVFLWIPSRTLAYSSENAPFLRSKASHWHPRSLSVSGFGSLAFWPCQLSMRQLVGGGASLESNAPPPLPLCQENTKSRRARQSGEP